MRRLGKKAVSALVVPAARVALCTANSPRGRVASPAGFQNAASPRPSRATAVWPMPTAWAPTGKSRNKAPEFWIWPRSVTAWPDSGTVGLTDRKAASRTLRPTVRRSDRPSEGLRLIDQHDGDVVFDGIAEATRVTDQLFGGRGAVLQRSLALGADEDREEVGRETHTTYPRRLSDGSWRRHLGSTFTCSSRKTCWSSRASILARAAWPSALIVRPPSPITMPFWLSRSM